jgi:hypothetical protein
LGEVTGYKSVIKVLEGGEDNDNAGNNNQNMAANVENQLSSEELFQLIYESYE